MKEKTVRFGKNLKIIRNKYNMSQVQLAEMLCVERQTISAWEKSIGKPDVYALAKICEIFDIKSDDILFSKDPEPVEMNMDYSFYDYYAEPKNYINTIKTKGLYDILEDDVQGFIHNMIAFPFSYVMGTILELKEYGYNIVDIFGNGFSIYFPTDEMAQKFSSDLYDIIDDGFLHCDESKTAVSYARKAQKIMDCARGEIIDEMLEKIFGDNLSYYWVDNLDRIRGYGKTKEDCEKQAKEQECLEYTILEN